VTDDRPEPPSTGAEREMLRTFLDFHRATLAMKCAGLPDEALRRRAVPTSGLSLLGLVRHMAEVEQGWFRQTAGRTEVPPLYWTEDNDDADFDDIADADVAADFEAWRQQCEHARQVVAKISSLDEMFGGRTREYSLRWIMVHMIEEYARHNGHADLLRERIDGQTGD
jgi:uncharacterized damage-inducible protein DinB